MKNLIEKYITAKKEFEAAKRETEDAFSEFLEGIPGWRDIVGSILITNSYGPLDYEDILIPEVRDIDFTGGDRISFKIRIPSDTWVPKYLETGWFPLVWLTNPGSFKINKDYLRRKMERRQEALRRYQGEEEDIKSQIKGLEEEIDTIRALIEKEE